MITVTQKTVNLQAEGQYGEIKVQGFAEIRDNQIISISGSIFHQEEYLGSFTSGEALTLTLDNKENVNLMSTVSEAIITFASELTKEISSF